MTDTGIIYLQKDKFDLYSQILGKVIEFRFVPEIVKDLDVINPELLESLIKLFIANYKITAGSLIMVLADNASFIKDFQQNNAPPQLPQQGLTQEKAIATTLNVTQDTTKEDIKYFIEHVPFDEVASETYPMTTGIKAWATNKELYTSIASAFEKQGFHFKAVLPGLVFDGNIGSKAILDPVMASDILQKYDTVKQHSLLTQKPMEVQIVANADNKNAEKSKNSGEYVEIEDKPTGGKSKKRLFVMIGVFAILIIILIFVYIGSLQQAP